MAEMSIIDQTEQILYRAKALERQKLYESETRNYRIHAHLIAVLKQLDADNMPNLSAESKESIRHMINYLFAMDYLDVDNSIGVAFALAELSYVEKKAIKQAIEPALSKYCEPTLKYLAKINLDVFCPEKTRNEIAEWSEKRKTAEQRVIASKCRYIELLKDFTDMKLGPLQRDATEDIRLGLALNKVKTEFLTKATKEMIYCPNHAEDAIRFAHQQLNLELEKKNAVNK